MKNFYFFLLCSILILSCSKKHTPLKKKLITEYVDSFIGTGTGGHGHTYPGATVPFGMLQVSPVNGISSWDWCFGYHYSDSIIVGFSHLSLSRTGIGDLADIILLMPINKKVDTSITPKSRDSLLYKSSYSHENEKASPGYYQLFLENHNINVELTYTKRTAFHKYTFAENDDKSVITDLGFAINWDRPLDTELKVEDDNTISGYRYSTGWAKNQKVFFVAKFSNAISEYELNTKKSTCQLFFNDKSDSSLFVKVAISSVSVDNAKENLDIEKEFDNVSYEAENIWNEKLSKLKIETSIDSLKTIFYTALYHAQLAPVIFSDKNGEFRKENDSIVTAKDYTSYSTLSFWDTFRAEHPLLTLIAPNKVSDIINSIHEYYKDKNVLPVWTLYANETNTMTGYHSIPVIVEAYIKGITNFNAEAVYEAMKTTMMNNDRGLNFYKGYGYIPYNLLDESVTITLEYAYDDLFVAQMVKSLGKEEDYNFFMKRSLAYQYLFGKETRFMGGRSQDNTTWNQLFDPKHSNHREQTDYTEGNAWQHSWYVPHDVDNLIKLHGGDTFFSNRLELLFNESSEITGDNVSVDISRLIGQYAHGNEPSHHIAYMFNYANRPWRTQYWTRYIMDSQYSTMPNGLSGNEDCGQMSTWYVLSSMGIYPLNPASTNYEIGSPLFEKVKIKVPNSEKKHFIITVENVSKDNIYIQSATLNQKEFNQTSISYKTILDGGKLNFVMEPEPNKNWV